MTVNVERLLTLTEAAEYAGVTRQAIHEALKGKNPRAIGTIIKGRWFLTKEEVKRVWGVKKKKRA